MKFGDFKNRLKNHPYFTSSIFTSMTTSPMVLHNQLRGWVEKGLVIKLRRGLYTLNDDYRKVPLSRKLLANVLYSPSYISMEYALSYYGLIPEAVFSTTSVTTKKTKKFVNDFGMFIYKSIKRNAFTGFISIKDEYGFDCLAATPEKALCDYFYFKVKDKTKTDAKYFVESMRLQNIDQLDLDKLSELSWRMGSNKVNRIVRRLIKSIRRAEL